MSLLLYLAPAIHVIRTICERVWWVTYVDMNDRGSMSQRNYFYARTDPYNSISWSSKVFNLSRFLVDEWALKIRTDNCTKNRVERTKIHFVEKFFREKSLTIILPEKLFVLFLTSCAQFQATKGNTFSSSSISDINVFLTFMRLGFV